MEEIIGVIFFIAGVYAAIGILLLLPLHRFALPVIDESARGASWGFKAAVSPGLVALWPIILRKWLAVRRGKNPHGRPDAPISSRRIRRSQALLIRLIAVALPLLAVAAFFGW